MSLQLTCAEWWHGEPETRIDPYRNHEEYLYTPIEMCQQPAAVLIVEKSADEQISEWAVAGYCAEHAPNAIHETQSSMGDDEFRVINIGAACVGEGDHLQRVRSQS